MAWWNIGGWGNTRHGLEIGGVSSRDVPGSIETGRWYDIRIELKGRNVKCYLDGRLIHDANFTQPKSLYAVASLAHNSNEVILKVVNASASALETDISLNGTRQIGSARAIVLASDKATDENSIENPTRVAPKTEPLAVNQPNFRHTFPGNSVTVLRVGAVK
jgi:alpha-L-arabinofuranosidase